MANMYATKGAVRAALLFLCFLLLPLLTLAQADKKGAENKKASDLSTNSLPPDDPNPEPTPYCKSIILELISEGCNSAVLQAYPPSGCTFNYILNGPDSQRKSGEVVNFTVTANGTYTLTAMGAQGSFKSSTVTVTKIFEGGRPTIIATGPTTFCQGGNVKLTASMGTMPGTFRWSTGATTKDIYPTAAGNYTVTFTSSTGCKATSTATTVTVNPRPVNNNIWASASTICLGQAVTVSSSGGTGTPSYWASSNGGASWDVLSGAYQGQSSFTHTPTTTGTYSYYVYNSNACGFCWDNGGSCAEKFVTVTVVPPPTATILAMTETGTDLATRLTVDVAGNPSAAYSWSPATGILGSATGKTIRVRPGPATTYTVTATSSTGCVSRASVEVQGNNQNFIIENTILSQGIKTADDLQALTVSNRQQQVTYFDGLGRPMQTVLTQASPLKKDIVTPVTYDALGRIDKSYLPYTKGTTGFYQSDAVTQQFAFYKPGTTANANIAKTPYPFAVPVYEPSPLNRVLEQGAPGTSWQPYQDSAPIAGAGHTVKMVSRTNGTGEVRLWVFDTDGKTWTNAYYGPGTLYVTETRDEQDNLSVEYKDLQGRVVMKKVQEATTVNSQTETGFLITQYVYDVLGNLRIVIQPEGYRNKLPAAVSGRITLPTAFLQDWSFFYDYDGRRRVVRKRMPGAGNVDIVYNQLDQPILTQDAVQRPSGSWSFTKYDVLGRPIMQGDLTLKEGTLALTRVQVQEAADAVAHQYEERTKVADVTPAGLGYTLTKTYPSVVETNLRSVTYYDDYGYAYLSGYTFQAEAGLTQTDLNDRLRGLVTATRTKVMGTSNSWLVAVNFYDGKYRLLQTVSDSYLAGAVALRADRTTTRYDFTGKPLETLLTHKKGTATHVVHNEFVYDHAGRLLKTLQRMGTNPATVKTLAAVTLSEQGYNELGQLVTKKLHAKEGVAALQKVDMRYNERGWLTKINDRTLAPQAGDPHPDLFGFELKYNEGLQLGTAHEAQFSGNISEALWATASDRVQRGYLYRYDKANRLSQASYKARGASSWNMELENYSLPGISYDANGNIKTLQRRGLTAGHAYTPATPVRSWGVVDDLAYAYAGNKLLAVDDAVAVTGPAGDFRDNGITQATEYTYDLNGNLLTDKNKGITAITYNQLNLPTRIAFGTKGNIEYTYSAAGQKLRKKVTEGAKVSYTDYAGMFVYQGDTLFAHTPEGRVLYQPLANEKWRYEYHLKDHLGNLRVSFAEATSTTQTATMETMAAQKEEQNFDNVDKTRHLDAVRSRTGSHAALLSTGRDKPIGPAKRVNLNQGDSLKVEAFGMFETERKRDIKFSLLSWLASSAAVTTGMNASGEMGKGKQNKGLPYIGAGLALAPQVFQKEERAPKAYLRYIVYDKDSAYVTSGYKALSREANKGWEKLELAYKAEQEGYAEIYVANESTEEAWFDDMAVTVAQPMLVQENHYDPWGLNLAGIEKQGTPSDHKFQYNGKEKQTELGLNWLDYGARMYDAQIGRWHVVDPLTDHPNQIDKTPYQYGWNNPTNLTDPDGKCPECPDEVYVPLADNVYEAKEGSSVNGWTVVKGGIFENTKTGFKGALYQGSGEWEGQFIFATAGTQELGKDGVEDAKQLFGSSNQYDESVTIAEGLSNEYAGVSFTGHSLGGGLASANALKTEGKAVTFNAAGLSGATKKNLGLSGKAADITAYVVSGEALDVLQRNVGLRAEGNRLVILPSIGKNALDKHKIHNVQAAFNLWQSIIKSPSTRTFNMDN